MGFVIIILIIIMEYLPEKKRTQQTKNLNHDKKIHDFRQYLADSEVILAIVKCKLIIFIIIDLIALRSQPKLPEDP